MFGTNSGLILKMAQNISGDHQLGMTSKQVIILVRKVSKFLSHPLLKCALNVTNFVARNPKCF